MCPLVAAPNRGYADWQRVENYDSGILYPAVFTNQAGITTSPIIDMSRYEYVGGNIHATSGVYTVTMTWFADAAATVTLGIRRFIVHGFISQAAQIRIPNLGPFLQVTTGQTTPSAYSGFMNLIGTNRYNPLEFIPPLPNLMNGQSLAIPASGSAVFAPNAYYAGPVVITMVTLVGNMSWITQWLDQNNNLFEIDGVSLGGGTVSKESIVPPGYWQVQVNNTNAAVQSVNIYITQSVTGSS